MFYLLTAILLTVKAHTDDLYPLIMMRQRRIENGRYGLFIFSSLVTLAIIKWFLLCNNLIIYSSRAGTGRT